MDVVAVVTIETPYMVLLSDGGAVALPDLTSENPIYKKLEPAAQKFLEFVRVTFA